MNTRLESNNEDEKDRPRSGWRPMRQRFWSTHTPSSAVHADDRNVQRFRGGLVFQTFVSLPASGENTSHLCSLK